ncbi:M13 family metallopeptidase [Clostridioides sp. ES-S-0108-01]|uniref:M13-type metalloendopeptidase n=1 Tax=Clostridioides sp. ES-S-0108-01 TaxID=2770773 RepID=UPI001D0C6B2E|nr:M13 family metallopeptidase [Clostridioides sp. ES-S-0108-01]UDN50945.1 M13 family metallopeptidase [Clostridioides sp. ES-S-0107-01]
MKNSKIKVLFLAGVMTLSMALIACSTNNQTALPKVSENPATLKEIADYLVNAADDYNKKSNRKTLLADLGEEKDKATRLQALVMVGRAFGDLPAPQGNNERLAPKSIDLSTVPKWAAEELQKLADGGILAPSDLGQEGEDDSNLKQEDSGTIPAPDAEKGSDTKKEAPAPAGDSEGEDTEIEDGDFGLAGPDDATGQTESSKKDDAKKNQGSVLEKEVSLKEVETYCKRIYALFGTNLKDDFYQNINKQELDNAKLPEGEAVSGGSQTVEAETNEKVRKLIKKVVESGDDYAYGSNEQKIRDFYRSIIAERKEGLTPLKSWFDKIEQADDLAELRDVQIKLIQKMGLNSNGLLPFSLSKDLTDSNKTVLNLTSGFMAMTLEDYENKESAAHQEYRGTIVANLIKCGETQEQASENADAIIAQEAKELKNGMTSKEAADLNNYNNTFTMSELSDLFPKLGVVEFFTSLGFENTMTIQCYDSKAIKIRAQHTNQSELARLKAQMKLNLLTNNEEFLTGKVSKEDALDEVSTYLTNEVGQLYVAEYFKPEAKADIEKMTAQLIETYKNRISALDWMSEESKKEAINKLDTLKVYIGYPDEWPDSKLKISAPENGGSYFENMSAIGREGLRQNIVEQKEGQDSFGLTVYMVNAAANRQANSLVFPAGILQTPFYDPEASFEENLGGIGVIIAHEISHSFDDQGAQYDSTGAVRDWWKAEDYTHFKELCQNAVQFYDGEEPASGITTDGQATLSENIADIGGMASALELLGTMKNPDYDKFFRNYAKSWLLLSDRSYVAGMAASDEHAPKKLRVNKVLQNFEEFYKTYKIGEGDGMYVAPKNRVKIW